MTKVSATSCRSWIRNTFITALIFVPAWSCGMAQAQAAAQLPVQPGTRPGPAERLYLQLASVGLNADRVFRVRGSALDRPSIHMTFEDGTIAFTKDVTGRITGAFFAGEGEVLLTPSNKVERNSLSLFTGMAILEERFSTAYLRFNDDTAIELQPGFRAAENPQEFVTQWDATARTLAETDAMRLLATFSRFLPLNGSTDFRNSGADSDHLMHARLHGNTLGVFDILYDSTAGEQVEAGQARPAAEGTVFYDVWTSFPINRNFSNSHRKGYKAATLNNEDEAHEDRFVVRDFVIDADIRPPKEISAEATLKVQSNGEPTRFLAFELSRFLKIQSVECDGRTIEFIQNPSLEGTRLARRGNDIVAVILPEPLEGGREINLRFVYGGEVLAEAGKGLLYVGARGTWYPNRNVGMSNFDITFHYPQGWTLVATGKPAPVTPAQAGVQRPPGEQVTRWLSETPIPVAGFDLGKYVKATARSGGITVEAYATPGVERDFPRPEPVPEEPQPGHPNLPPAFLSSIPPSPARTAMAVAEKTAQAIDYYAHRFGPFPYSQLSVTQLPGTQSQGWPGLVFLSSYAFLTHDEMQDLHMNPTQELSDQQVPAHEAAHQWWGDLITWRTYRDQWFSEGLANYCALMILQEKNPDGFRQMMNRYRRELIEADKDGNLPKDAGPVTLGARLSSSHFPRGYDAISYGRGTWLFHMLRSMMLDASKDDASMKKDGARSGAPQKAEEEPFVRALRKFRERYAGKAITTREMLNVFAEELPPSMRYEGKASLDWFLESWVNGTSVPRLELHSVKLTPKGNGLAASGIVRQKNPGEDLVTSVPIYAVVAGKTKIYLGRVFADGPETTFHFPAPPGTHQLLLDPNETVLSAVH